MVTKRKATTTPSKKSSGASARGTQKSVRPQAKKTGAAKTAKTAKTAPASRPASRSASQAAPTPRPAAAPNPQATPVRPAPSPPATPARPAPPMRPMQTASASRPQPQPVGQTGRRVLPAKPAKPLRRRRMWPWVVGALLLVIVVLVGLFAWNRWWRYDDAEDMLGNWLANDTSSLVVIDGETIRIADDVAYDYTIDPFAKTITFTFGSMKGSGRYWFSEDRQQLVITDGDTYSALSTLLEDISYDAEQLKRSILGQSPLTREPKEGATLLEREGAEAGALPTRPTHDDGLDPDEALDGDDVADTGDAADAGDTGEVPDDTGGVGDVMPDNSTAYDAGDTSDAWSQDVPVEGGEGGDGAAL